MSLVGMLGGNAQAKVAIHFHTTQIAWFTLVGVLAGTFAIPFAAKAGAMYGKKRVILIVALLGLVGDLVAALATDYGVLLVGRCIAGLYTPAAMLAFAITRDVFPRHLVGLASGLLGGAVGLVALTGPFLSGWLLDDHGFRAVLWFMVGGTLLSLLLVAVFVPESPIREGHGRMDWPGGILLGGAITAIVYAIGKGSDWGWTSGEFIAYIAGSLVALALFVVVESRTAEPLLPLALVRRRQVWTVLLATSAATGAIYGVGPVLQLLALMPKIPTISDGLGWSATHNAWVTAPMSVLIIAAAVGTGVLARRVDARFLLGGGAVLAAVGYGIGTQLHHSASEFITMGVVAGVGMGMIVSIVPIMIIEVVAPEEQALANGAQSLGQGVAQVLIAQLAFVLMAQHGKELKGTQFYLDAGFTNGLWLIAGCCAVAALLALLIPKVKRLDDAEAGQAA
ncbi:MFS transporter [Actinomadura fibrosa]|uniref:MFS transporter n=1 Tax=Actinomadura fibrosa TaxID=111802 RepID=UPI00366A7E43